MTDVKPKFYTAKYDRVFRKIFVNTSDHKLMEAVLSACLDKDVQIIKFIDTELNVRNVKERVKRLDVIVEAENEIYNIELNTNYDKATRVRNFNYFTAFYSTRTKRNEKYDYKTNFIHIDLSFGMKENYLKNEYYVYSPENKDKYVENFKIIVINMDEIKKAWYDKNEEEIGKYKHLMMLDLEETELKKLSEKDEIVMEYNKKVTELNEVEYFKAPYSAAEDAIALHNTQVDIAYEEGMMASKIENAKAMLKDKIGIDRIIKYTGLTKAEIESIKID